MKDAVPPATVKAPSRDSAGPGRPRRPPRERRRERLHRAAPSSGRPLDPTTRASMEHRFAHDFSRVRIHTGAVAARSARAAGARAWTLGSDIVFGAGQYRPDTGPGRHLLAHELAHVAQWADAGSPVRPGRSLRSADDGAGDVQRLERDAAAAADRVVRGEPAGVREALPRHPLPLRHPVYISGHGGQGFLRLANQFFSRWGYSPITTGVDSIEEVVADLSTKSAIERVTIVTHAHPTNLFMAFLSGGPSQILKSDWEADLVDPSLTEEERRRRGPDLGELTLLERHYVPEETLDWVLEALRADPQHERTLARIGSADDPIVRQFVWWALEWEQVDEGGFGRRRERDLKRHIETVLNDYRDTMLVAMAAVAGLGSSGGPPVTDGDFTALRNAVRTVAERIDFENVPRDDREDVAEQLAESPSGQINRVLRNPDFAANLTRVRSMIKGGSWIEVQGCRAGQDQGYLQAMQGFFTGPRGAPRVTAPDWFQFFGNYGFRRPVRNDDAAMARLWRQQPVREALEYWHPIVTGQALPDPADADDLQAYLEAPHVLPLTFPGRQGETDEFILLAGMEEDAFLDWFARHSYRLTSQADIRAQLYNQRGAGQNIRHTVVDWLQEDREAPTNLVFRPDPEYQQHIVSA